MGDMSELRGLVVIISFLGAMTLLLSWIPGAFFVATEGRNVYVPEWFEAIELYSFVDTKTVYLNDTGGSLWWVDNTFRIKDIDIGNYDIDLYYKRPTTGFYNLFLIHIHYDWYVFPSDHRLEFISMRGIDRDIVLDINEINTDANGANYTEYRARCKHTTYHIGLSYNSTAYSSFSDAWDNGELVFFAGVDFDHTNTTYNAWNFVSMLLFFQLPEIDIYTNLLLGIPLWIGIIYVSYILILRAIGALFGGGA